MKKKMFSILLVCCLALTGCSSGTSNYATSAEDSSTSSNGAGFSVETNNFNMSQVEDFDSSDTSYEEQEVSKEDDNN